jgi:hypothetical protein
VLSSKTLACPGWHWLRLKATDIPAQAGMTSKTFEYDFA